MNRTTPLPPLRRRLHGAATAGLLTLGALAPLAFGIGTANAATIPMPPVTSAPAPAVTSAPAAPSSAPARGPLVQVVFALRASATHAHRLAQLAATPQPRGGPAHAARLAALAQLAPPASSEQAVTAFAARHHLSVLQASRWSVTLQGPATVAQAALNDPLVAAPGRRHPHGPALYLRPSHPLQVPAALSGAVSSVAGMDTRPLLQPRAIPGGYTGADLRSAYAVPTGAATGSGITVATVQFSNWYPSDLTSYAQAAGIPLSSGQVQTVPVDGGTTSTNGSYEVALDTETILATAPRANQRVYVAPDTLAGMVDVYNQIASDAAAGKVQVVSTSWGMCEGALGAAVPTQVATAIQNVVAAGATVFAASGDAGAYDCSSPSAPNDALSVDFPASLPSVVAVGGTTLTGSSSSGWSESAWGPSGALVTNPSGYVGNASGGGQSLVYARPSWQQSIPLAGSNRLVPDVAAVANPNTGIGIYSQGTWSLGGGTSAGGPDWAAGLADALSGAGRTTGIGDIHAALYAHPTAFRQITSGNNFAFSTSPSGGYNEVTGLGTPQWSLLAPDLGLTPLSTPTPPPPSPALGPVASALNTSGSNELFSINSQGDLVHNWQCSACTGGWSGWAQLAPGTFAGTPTAIRTVSGQVEIFARTTGGQLDTFWQNAPSAGPWDGPYAIGAPGGVASAPVVVPWSNGRLELYGVTAGGQVDHAYEFGSNTFTSWSGWTNLGFTAAAGTRVTAARNTNGNPEVFAMGPDGNVWHAWWMGTAWSGFGPLTSGAGLVGTPAVGQNPDGRLEVFARQANGTLFHTWQAAPSAGPWYAGNLGGQLSSDPVIAMWPGSAIGGRLEVFATNSAGQLQHIWQTPTNPASYWSGWASLGGTNVANRLDVTQTGVNGDPGVAAASTSTAQVISFTGVGSFLWSAWIPLP